MENGVWIGFKDNRIIGYVMTEPEAMARVKQGQADYFEHYNFKCRVTRKEDYAMIPYLTIKEEE